MLEAVLTLSYQISIDNSVNYVKSLILDTVVPKMSTSDGLHLQVMNLLRYQDNAMLRLVTVQKRVLRLMLFMLVLNADYFLPNILLWI